jgi:hypothetical protein
MIENHVNNAAYIMADHGIPNTEKKGATNAMTRPHKTQSRDASIIASFTLLHSFTR